jgi:hypothetical protein
MEKCKQVVKLKDIHILLGLASKKYHKNTN